MSKTNEINKTNKTNKINKKHNKEYKWKWLYDELKHSLNACNLIESKTNNYVNSINFRINIKSIFSFNTKISNIDVYYYINEKKLILKAEWIDKVNNYGISSSIVSDGVISFVSSDKKKNKYNAEKDKILNDIFRNIKKKIKEYKRCEKCLSPLFIDNEKDDTKCISCHKARLFRSFSKFPIGDFNQEECSICLTKFTKGEILAVIKCGHYFHINCITKCPKKENNPYSECPICKKQYNEIIVQDKSLCYNVSNYQSNTFVRNVYYNDDFSDDEIDELFV